MKNLPQTPEQIEAEITVFRNQLAALDQPGTKNFSQEDKEILSSYFINGIRERQRTLREKKTIAHRFRNAEALTTIARRIKTMAKVSHFNVVDPVTV